jgi:hypothetical protein
VDRRYTPESPEHHLNSPGRDHSVITTAVSLRPTLWFPFCFRWVVYLIINSDFPAEVPIKPCRRVFASVCYSISYVLKPTLVVLERLSYYLVTRVLVTSPRTIFSTGSVVVCENISGPTTNMAPPHRRGRNKGHVPSSSFPTSRQTSHPPRQKKGSAYWWWWLFK